MRAPSPKAISSATGTCYEDAAWFFICSQMPELGSKYKGLQLVHGRVRNVSDGKVIHHAWLEQPSAKRVFVSPGEYTEKGIPFCDLEVWYNLRVLDVQGVYTDLDTVLKLIAHGHTWGPWKKQELAEVGHLK